ncbi:AcrR family transcriptional regulator [Arthrobacter sp. B2I5]|uniref:TetR/AcrR family transcriptional regulator n=1 Tax=Arthrobacter sp. B2I5 TaxID=3042266 RepID=UPI0027851270|nr:TetR/AcrR family transcriptional regulator [Arthrobacter sp. B2I5]MDQ0826060.1 AcrR family transcriptional regulator [Arthrobacter sp. B2I5]
MNTSRRNARGEASLQRILQSTVQLVSRYGYDNTTIARIVRATERPASSIYWFFENKDELITAALENSYSHGAPSRRPWEEFKPERPLLEQLREELEPELRASESEDPLRLGIMLALEGSAANSKIQEPFQRRRTGAQLRIEAWWEAAFAGQSAVEAAARAAGVEWMGRLTMAFLDGHYISDVAVEDRDAAQRSTIVAHALAGAFEVMTGSAQHLVPERNPLTALPARPETAQTAPETPNLLHVTRALVAEHGYEGATMSRICEASGMKRSSIYWRYKDKDALITAAVAEPFLELLTPLRELPMTSNDWLQELSSALTKVMSDAHEHPDTVKSGLLLKLQRWDPPTSGGSAVLAGTASAEEQLALWFEEVLPAAQDKETIGVHLAWIVARLCEGLMLGSALGHPLASDAVAGILVPMLSKALEGWQSKV